MTVHPDPARKASRRAIPPQQRGVRPPPTYLELRIKRQVVGRPVVTPSFVDFAGRNRFRLRQVGRDGGFHSVFLHCRHKHLSGARWATPDDRGLLRVRPARERSGAAGEQRPAVDAERQLVRMPKKISRYVAPVMPKRHRTCPRTARLRILVAGVQRMAVLAVQQRAMHRTRFRHWFLLTECVAANLLHWRHRPSEHWESR